MDNLEYDDTSVKGVLIDNVQGADISVPTGNGWTVTQSGNFAEITFPGGGTIPEGNYPDQFTVCFENITGLPQQLDLYLLITDPAIRMHLALEPFDILEALLQQ